MPSFPRITQNLTLTYLQGSVQRIRKDLFEAQRQVATQRRISVPSDDPGGAGTILRLRSTLSKMESTGSTVGFAISLLSAQDGALGNASAILDRAKEIAVQQASSLVSPGARQAAAEEVAALERALIGTANSELGGRYLFGGLVEGGDPPFMEPNTPPLDPFAPPFDPLDTYVGPAEDFRLRIGSGEEVRVATPGDQIFQAGITALDNLRVALANGEETSGNINEVEQASDTIRNERSSVGARLKRLLDRQAEIDNSSGALTEILSGVQDVDLASSISTLVHLEQVLSATLAAGSKLLNLDVLDFVSL